MLPRVRKLYNHAISDAEYHERMLSSADDRIGPRSDMIEKHIVAAAYYGYLIGTKGANWEQGLDLPAPIPTLLDRITSFFGRLRATHGA